MLFIDSTSRRHAALALSAVGLGCAVVAARRCAAVAVKATGLDDCSSGPGAAAHFVAEGYVSPVRVLSASDAAAALREFNAWAAATFPDGQVCGDLRFKPHLFLPFVSRLVRHPSILDIVQNVLGTENLILWSSDWNIKQQHSDGHYTAHQDATFTGLVPPERGVTVCACNTAAAFAPHSHHRGTAWHRDLTTLSPGQGLRLANLWTKHTDAWCSGPNRTSPARCPISRSRGAMRITCLVEVSGLRRPWSRPTGQSSRSCRLARRVYTTSTSYTKAGRIVAIHSASVSPCGTSRRMCGRLGEYESA